MLLLNVCSIFLYDDIWLWRVKNEFIVEICEIVDDMYERESKHVVDCCVIYTNNVNLLIIVEIRM